MNKNKNNKKYKKIGVIFLLALAIIGCYFVSGTYAKYTSDFSTRDDIDTALWAWRINGDLIGSYEDSIKEESFQFELFHTVYEKSCGNGAGNIEHERFAPGTCGRFDILLENVSEIDANYAISFVEEQTNLPSGVSRIPIEYSKDNGQTWSSNISDINVSPTLIRRGETATNFTIKWRWVYERGTDTTLTNNDIIDTKIGYAANSGNYPNVKVIPTITVTQTEV